MQLRKIFDVLARGQPLVEAARIGQHTQAPPRFQRLARGIQAIDQHAATIRPHQRVQHAQRGGLARAVGAEQTGDATVGRGEADTGNGLYRAEALVQIAHFDHGAAPLKSR